MNNLKAMAIGTRNLSNITHGKIYEVLEYLKCGVGHRPVVFVTNDNGKKCYLHAHRFEFITTTDTKEESAQ